MTSPLNSIYPEALPIEMDAFDSKMSNSRCAKLYHDENWIDCPEIDAQCRRRGVDQLTVFVKHTRENIEALFDDEYQYLTSKVKYVKPAKPGDENMRKRWSPGISLIPYSNRYLKRLIDLSYIVGEKSRYFLNRNDPDLWRRVYKQWVMNAVNGYVTDIRLAVDDKNDYPVGFIFMKDKGNLSDVNLIAVETAYRKRNIGGNLLSYCEEDAIARGRTSFEVITEAENIDAQRLYQKHGYTINQNYLVYQKNF